ncbi:TetR/AcrR family transcriptional regulator [Ostreibacterium oceani]|uniref:TetR family transcriptional regulator n=1 Tax=Ostreibacterium oceani TaxID=2654998 RepID=A0A6N7EVW2_9GAMM|nr:TetR/AcrR family transcriptional regulator [Ostreibacterium oceani]MPV86033.1 TetR family transcriptional regulator [Ostreibacterium oceani]
MNNDLSTSPASKTWSSKNQGSPAIWLQAAYELIIEQGVDAVKIMTLAKRLRMTRTSFYWHFADREALLQAIITRWEAQNTGNLIRQTQKPAGNICQAILNVFDCWLDDALFDAPLDLAIRNWARNDSALQARLDTADARRLAALAGLFTRFGYSALQAEVRSKTVLYTQIGYIYMQVLDAPDKRLAMIADYVQVFTGVAPSISEIEAFVARHS